MSERPVNEGIEAMAPGSDEVVEPPEGRTRRGRLDRAMRAVEIAEAAIGGLLLVVILVLVMTQVILRFAPTAGLVWAGELAKFAMVWGAFVLAGYLMGRDEHVTLDVIDHVLPGRAVRVMIGIAQVITAAICVAAFYEGYHLVTNQVDIRSPAAQIPMSIVYSIPMIGMGLTALRCAINIATRRKP